MRTSQIGDRVRVHYAKKYEDGSVRSSRTRGDAPLELTVGTDHPRLPGLGTGLVGLTEGETITKALAGAAAPPGSVVWDRKEARVAYVVPSDKA